MISLGFLWDFLKPILSDALKDRLKPKGSEETAKKRALHLYNILSVVNQKTDDFVNELQSFYELVDKGEPELIIFEKRGDLRDAAVRLVNTLPKLASALDAINPQLEIHQHELVRKIVVYQMSRGRLLLEESVLKIDSEAKATLQQLVTQANENRNKIREAIEDFRTFLAKEFPFKEAF